MSSGPCNRSLSSSLRSAGDPGADRSAGPAAAARGRGLKCQVRVRLPARVLRAEADYADRTARIEMISDTLPPDREVAISTGREVGARGCGMSIVA